MNLDAELPGSSFKTMSTFFDGLSAFGEELRIEARRAQLIMSTRNLSLTGQAVIRFSPLFFDKYILSLGQEQSLRGRLLSKKLRMLFRKNLANAASLAKCIIHIDDCSAEEGVEYSQFNLVLGYQNGVKKKHSLWFSESDSVDQLYPESAPYEFNANPNLFSSYTTFFNSNEVAEIVLECTPTSVTMRSCPDRMSHSKNKVPMETIVKINSSDFQRYSVQENVTMVFNLKEFKSVLHFMETIQAPIFARFERAGEPIVFFYKDSNVIAEFALATSEHDVDLLQNEFNSVNMSIVSGGTASSTSSARNTSANNASPPVRSNAINDTQPEPDTANVRRLNHGAMNLGYESDTPSPKRPSTNASYRESLKRLKQARRPHHTSTPNDDGSSSLEMHGPIFSPRSPNYNHNSFESMDNDLPFHSNPGNGEGSSSHKY